MPRTRRLDLHDLVRELTQTTQHREMYMRKRSPRYHVTTNPPLLVQLKAAASPNAIIQAGQVAHPASRPPAMLDAIDTLALITNEARTWTNELTHTNNDGTVIQLVTRLGALAQTQDRCRHRTPRRDPSSPRTVICCTQHRIEADVRRWWTLTRIVTTWDTPAFKPNNTCPLCGHRGTIHIREADRLAYCDNRDCRASWDNTTIGLLAEHIRTENGEHQEAS